MDTIDTAIITAFNGLVPKIRDSRIQAALRFVRTNAPILARPLRDFFVSYHAPLIDA